MIRSRSRRSRSIVTKSAGAPGASAPVPGAPVALRPLRDGEAEEFRRCPGSLEAEAAVDHLHQPHLAQHVVVLVQRQPVDADRDGAAASVRGGDRREAGAQMHVGAEIGDDARAGRRDHLDLVGPGVDAMRQRQPLRQEADVAEIANDAVGKLLRRPRRADRWSPADACGCAGRSAPNSRRPPPAAASSTIARRPGRTARRPWGRRLPRRSHRSARCRPSATSARGRTFPRWSCGRRRRDSDSTGSLSP